MTALQKKKSEEITTMQLGSNNGEPFYLEVDSEGFINGRTLARLARGVKSRENSLIRETTLKKLVPSYFYNVEKHARYDILEERLTSFVKSNPHPSLPPVGESEYMYKTVDKGTWFHPLMLCFYAQYIHPILGSIAADGVFPEGSIPAELRSKIQKEIKAELDELKNGVHKTTPAYDDMRSIFDGGADLNFFSTLKFTNKVSGKRSFWTGYTLIPGATAPDKKKGSKKPASKRRAPKSVIATVESGPVTVLTDKLHKALNATGDTDPSDVPGLNAVDAANEYAEKMWKQCVRRSNMPLSTLQEAAMLEALGSLVEVQFLVGRNIIGEDSDELTFRDENSIRLTVEVFIKEFVTTNKWIR